MIDSNSVKTFWDKRGAKYSGVPFESIANLEEDPALLDLKIRLETEQVMPRLAIDESSRVVDLGAGCGQWAFRFAPLVKEVAAVEYTRALVDIGRVEAQKRKAANVTFIHCAAEDFPLDQAYDLAFISGLFVYMTDEQAQRLLKKLSGLDDACQVFLRDGTSILPHRHLIENRYSEVLKTNYSAIYRTREEYLKLFARAGFSLVEDGNMFPEDCRLNKYPETRLRFYSFKRGQ